MINDVDLFKKDTSLLKSKKLFLLDMDGTIYNEDTLFDGTHEFLYQIVRRGGRYVFITNNSSKSVDDYVLKLRKMGIETNKENFFTSTQAATLLLKSKYPDILVYCQGTHSMITELKNSGIQVIEDVDSNAGLILVGFDTELTGQKLRNTCEMLQKDIPFYATNPDIVCPVSFGYIPDCGSMCQMFKSATGRMPIFIGKPEPTMLQIVMDKFGYSKEDTVVIGDRLYTDIASGSNAGVDTVCVLSGESTEEDILKSSIKPTWTLKSINNIY